MVCRSTRHHESTRSTRAHPVMPTGRRLKILNCISRMVVEHATRPTIGKPRRGLRSERRRGVVGDAPLRLGTRQPVWMGLWEALPLAWPVVKGVVRHHRDPVAGRLTRLAREVRGMVLSLRHKDFVVRHRWPGCTNLPIVLRRMVASFLSHIVASPDAQHPPNAARRRRDQADGAASGAIRVTEAGRAVALTATEYELQRVLSFNARVAGVVREHEHRAHLHQEPAPQALRGCGAPGLYLQRARGRLPE